MKIFGYIDDALNFIIPYLETHRAVSFILGSILLLILFYQIMRFIPRIMD